MLPDLRLNRIQELHQQFSDLAGQIPEGPTRQAISLLHAMMQEALRVGYTPAQGTAGDEHLADKLQQLLNYHKSAPAMEGAAQAAGLSVGQRAPDFALPDATGNLVRLSDYRGQTVVLVFYPLDWSPACSDQLSLYQMELEEFARRNVSLLAISVDSIYSHGAWAMLRGLEFPLLSDFEPKGQVARLYDVYRPTDGFSERALYIIDGDGEIRYAHVSPQLHQIPDIYELYGVLDQVSAATRTAVGGAAEGGEAVEREVMPA